MLVSEMGDISGGMGGWEGAARSILAAKYF